MSARNDCGCGFRLAFQWLAYTGLFLSLIGISSPAAAAGRTAFPVLQELVDPRCLALGGATIADDGWGGGVLLNPAAAVGAARSGSVNYARHTLDLWSGRLSLNYPVSGNLMAGGYITSFDYGKFDHTGDAATDEFSAGEYVLGLFAARRLMSGLGGGATVKMVWGQLAGAHASGVAVDAGLVFDPKWERLRFGLALRNLGRQQDGYSREKFPLPTEVVVGGARKLLYLPLTLNVAVSLSRTGEGTWEADFLPGKPGISAVGGGEFVIPTRKDGQAVKLRLGYRSLGQDLRVGTNSDMLAGFSFGIGLPVNRYQFDFAFAPMGALGEVHRFGFTTKF